MAYTKADSSDPFPRLAFADLVPDAGHPVGDQHVGGKQQEQRRGAVLEVVVQLACHSAQPQKADDFQRAEERPDPLNIIFDPCL